MEASMICICEKWFGNWSRYMLCIQGIYGYLVRSLYKPLSVSMASTAAKILSSMESPLELMVAARTRRPSVTLVSSSRPWSFMSSRHRNSFPIVSPRRLLSCFSSRILCSYHSSFLAISCSHSQVAINAPSLRSEFTLCTWMLENLQSLRAHIYIRSAVTSQPCTCKVSKVENRVNLQWQRLYSRLPWL